MSIVKKGKELHALWRLTIDIYTWDGRFEDDKSFLAEDKKVRADFRKIRTYARKILGRNGRKYPHVEIEGAEDIFRKLNRGPR